MHLLAGLLYMPYAGFISSAFPPKAAKNIIESMIDKNAGCQGVYFYIYFAFVWVIPRFDADIFPLPPLSPVAL